MFPCWSRKLLQLVARRKLSQARRRSSVLASCGDGRGAMISRAETLESRNMLTNVVAVTLAAGTAHFTDVSLPGSTTGDHFTISYTGTQYVLTGQNGTYFRIGSQYLTTYTASISSPLSIDMTLNRNANSVAITGDGSASLANLTVNLGPGRQSNSLTLTKVLAGSVAIYHGGSNSDVKLTQCRFQGYLWVDLGYSSGDLLDLESTTVAGADTSYVGQLIVNHTTINGLFTDVQLGKNSLYTSTASNYEGNVLVSMGRDSAIEYLYSPDGPSHIHGYSVFIGRPGHDLQGYLGAGSKTNNTPATITVDVPSRLIHTDVHFVPATTTVAPTVNALSAATTTPTITGTYSTQNTASLSVTVNGTTYTLGSSSQLTSPTAGRWSLNLTGSPLPTSTTSFTVTATSYDKWGNAQSATGTVTNEQAIIAKYVAAQGLTSSDLETSSGLNYAITTKGSGPLPTAGQIVATTYTGYLLNADGTLGSEFDSNTDGTHPSDPNPFTFSLGAGNVIKGWDEAFALLPVGSTATLIIPSALAYGTAGSGSSIPPNSVLVFKVTLISAT